MWSGPYPAKSQGLGIRALAVGMTLLHLPLFGFGFPVTWPNLVFSGLYRLQGVFYFIRVVP